MTIMDFIDEVYTLDMLGKQAGNWVTTLAAKKDCANRLERNFHDLRLPPFSRDLFSFRQGGHMCRPMSDDTQYPAERVWRRGSDLLHVYHYSLLGQWATCMFCNDGTEIDGQG